MTRPTHDSHAPTLLTTVGSVPLASPACIQSNPLNVPANWFAPLTVEMIQAQLDDGFDINAKIGQGSSILVRAGNSRAGADVWRYLIDRGARMAEPQLEERPAIFWVSKGGTPEAVRLVLGQPGVEVNVLDDSGRNAFAHATRMQADLQVYRALISAGVDIHNRDANGRTAVHEAAMRSGYVHVFEFLDSLGLSYDDLDVHGWDAFLNAAWRNRSFDVVAHLANHGDVARTGHDGMNAAMLAAANNPNADVLRWLIAQGLSVDGVDASGATALIRSGSNNEAVAEHLLGLGQDVNAADNAGNTPFIRAGAGRTSGRALARLLARAGADIHAVNDAGANALMVALENGEEYKDASPLIRLLIEEMGLRPTPGLRDGSTPLTIAARAGQSAEILRLLVAAGADVNAADANGDTALMIYARQGHNTGAMDYLVAAGADTHRRNHDGDTASELLRQTLGRAA